MNIEAENLDSLRKLVRELQEDKEVKKFAVKIVRILSGQNLLRKRLLNI